MGSPLTALDTTMDGFCRDLEILDNMSSRTCDTVHVFYVRAGQKTAEEILGNVVSYCVLLSVLYVLTVKAFYYHLNFLRAVVMDCIRTSTAIRIYSVSSLSGVPAILRVVCQCISASRVDRPHIHQLAGHAAHFR